MFRVFVDVFVTGKETDFRSGLFHMSNVKKIVESCLSSPSCCGQLCRFILPLKPLAQNIQSLFFVTGGDQMGRFQKVINLLSALLFYEA